MPDDLTPRVSALERLQAQQARQRETPAAPAPR